MIMQQYKNFNKIIIKEKYFDLMIDTVTLEMLIIMIHVILYDNYVNNAYTLQN